MKNRIKQVREIAGLTQVEYGKRLGVAGNTVTNYENGMRKPSNAIIIAICREFGISEKWLRTGNGDMFEDTKRTKEVENINERMKHLRIALHLSQEAFGAKLGIMGASVSLVESGKRNVSNQVITAVCREFNVNKIWLTTGNGDMFENVERTEEVGNINERIKHLRIALHLSQETFAERIGLKGSAISHLENGRRGITRQNINSICREFGVNESWLLTGNGYMFVFYDDNDIKESLIEYINSTDDTFTLNLFAAIAKRTQTERDILKLLLKDLLSFM